MMAKFRMKRGSCDAGGAVVDKQRCESISCCNQGKMGLTLARPGHRIEQKLHTSFNGLVRNDDLKIFKPTLLPRAFMT